MSARSLERSLEFHCGWVHPLYEDISTLSGSLEARTLCAPAQTSNREALQATDVFVVKKMFSHSSAQWAAVRTKSSVIRLPPQNHMSSMKSATIQGHSCSSASNPPTIPARGS